MPLIRRKKPALPIPEPYTERDVRIESSTCTGERTIGFYDKSKKMLMFAELVSSDGDISRFYERYGISRK
ncbi:MAG: hypothetical protein IJ071_01910 [Ruminococcus sp.]|nr:hypothetical protein [Ruminococcus sp.]